jgi:hypothetical protein
VSVERGGNKERGNKERGNKERGKQREGKQREADKIKNSEGIKYCSNVENK